MTEQLARSERYFAPSITRIIILPEVAADTLVPTRAEITAGIDISDDVADVSGWLIQAESIPTPDLGSLFASSIPGRTSVQDSSITLYADVAGVDITAELAIGDNVFVLFADGGDVAGRPADVFPARVASVGKERAMQGQAVRVVVTFTITAPPAQHVALPAHPEP